MLLLAQIRRLTSADFLFPGKECISQGSMDAGANISREGMYIARKHGCWCEYFQGRNVYRKEAWMLVRRQAEHRSLTLDYSVQYFEKHQTPVSILKN
ncbi:hypothetical protein DC094_14540 [Pelagibaculum spongiae]|uniref:Uncharacterized protein n=1 Tax=Pelagibaculum spongiae TaxID=2080658 RepID=A0A2V1GYQ1_9GAMM|nr:hypothetical protein DC094_14540 [Pelagibaculum spongiae]